MLPTSSQNLSQPFLHGMDAAGSRLKEFYMRPRWVTALLIITLPIWFVPGLLYVGWKECGLDTLKEIPMGAAWAFLGKKPYGY